MMKLEQLVAAMPAKHRPRVAILTGSAKAKERRAVYASLADGSIDIIVGTHALITDALEFKKLGLAVVDEQHRFCPLLYTFAICDKHPRCDRQHSAAAYPQWLKLCMGFPLQVVDMAGIRMRGSKTPPKDVSLKLFMPVHLFK